MTAPVCAAFVTVRTGSGRLPDKPLLDIAGAPAIRRLLDRLKTARLPNAVVVCTTKDPRDDRLESIARSAGVAVFRGETSDIIARWLGAALEYGVDFAVNCDGDDILCDPEYVDRAIRCQLETAADYVTFEGLPFGTAPTGYSLRALQHVCDWKNTEATEGQGRFFDAAPAIAKTVLRADPAVELGRARLTLDYPEDLRLFRAIFGELGTSGEFSLKQVVDLLRERGDLVEINAGRQAEYEARFNALYKPFESGVP